MTSASVIPVRKATGDDLSALVTLEVATFHSDRISPAQWRRHIASDSACVLVAGTKGRIDGAVVMFRRRRSSRARVYSLAVAAAARGRGVASALLAGAEAEALRRGCDTLYLEVRTDNRAAIALYERRGYRRMDRRVAFYEDGADAWRYAKALTTVTR